MKFKDSLTCEQDGLSEVVIEHRGENFYGYAKCHPDDEWSEFAGCRLAELRAQIKALKSDYQKARASYNECKKFVNSIKTYKNFNAEDPTAKAMFRQLNRRAREVNALNTRIAALELTLRASIRMQDQIRTKAKAKMKDKND